MNNIKIIFIIILMLGNNLYALTIVGSKHDLSSITGPGPIQATLETRICVFCHIPHNASPLAPLWNRYESSSNYTIYTSSTIDARMAQPNGSSKLCLSCHDGTIGLGVVRSIGTPIDMVDGVNLDPDDSLAPAAAGYIGLNLADDHPISFTNNPNAPETRDPPGPDVKLDAGGAIQCTSCHDAHDNQYAPFLVQDNLGSTICIQCHVKTNWAISSHEGAGATYTGGRLGALTVAEYGCEACHDPHSASESERLLDDNDAGAKVVEEGVCFNCHEGTIASNIQAQFLKAYTHNIENYSNVHSPNEAYAPSTEHVECVDCHNPHQAQGTVHTLGVDNNDLPANSVLEGVRGISVVAYGSAWFPPTFSSNIATKEYELCFKCHSTASTMFSGDEKGSMDIYFNPNNAAHHSVVSSGTSPPGITNTFTSSFLNENSTIYCSDCHGDNAAGSLAGPHGSGTEYLLAGETGDDVEYVCYKCHRRDVYGLNAANVTRSRMEAHDRGQHHVTAGLPANTPAISCFQCHGDFSNNLDGIYVVGGIHGANTGNLAYPKEDMPRRFLNGAGLEVTNVSATEVGCRGSGAIGCNAHSGGATGWQELYDPTTPVW